MRPPQPLPDRRRQLSRAIENTQGLSDSRLHLRDRRWRGGYILPQAVACNCPPGCRSSAPGADFVNPTRAVYGASLTRCAGSRDSPSPASRWRDQQVSQGRPRAGTMKIRPMTPTASGSTPPGSLPPRLGPQRHDHPARTPGTSSSPAPASSSPGQRVLPTSTPTRCSLAGRRHRATWRMLCSWLRARACTTPRASCRTRPRFAPTVPHLARFTLLLRRSDQHRPLDPEKNKKKGKKKKEKKKKEKKKKKKKKKKRKKKKKTKKKKKEKKKKKKQLPLLAYAVGRGTCSSRSLVNTPTRSFQLARKRRPNLALDAHSCLSTLSVTPRAESRPTASPARWPGGGVAQAAALRPLLLPAQKASQPAFKAALDHP